jgi:HAD superfamily hydrolase (TIGR01549 family)
MSPDQTLNILLERPYDLFIFDLDGTLYEQRKLRRKMTISLILKLIFLKITITELKIISVFRKQRELHKGAHSPTLGSDQYEWCAEAMGIPAERVRKTIEEYMYQFPLKYLEKFVYQGVRSVLDFLKHKKYKVAVYSDFPIEEKLASMKLEADYTLYSTHPSIGCFKPNKTGLLKICRDLNMPVEKAIFIGDRDDTDGESARMAGMSFLLVDIKEAAKGNFYKTFLNLITSQHDKN